MASNDVIFKPKRNPDGTRVKGKTDFAKLAAMTDDDIAEAVASDPDAAPIDYAVGGTLVTTVFTDGVTRNNTIYDQAAVAQQVLAHKSSDEQPITFRERTSS